jgi:cytochrome c
MKKKNKRLLSGVAIFALPLFFIHPFGRVKAANSPRPIFSGAQIEAPVLNVIQRSCQSCHSEQTPWPWYSYIPPASWMVERDVHDGRELFNMSRWDEYSQEKRIQILGEISVTIRNKQMPLPRYTLLHSEAKLSDADISLVDHWSHMERKRLKSAVSPAAGLHGLNEGVIPMNTKLEGYRATPERFLGWILTVFCFGIMALLPYSSGAAAAGQAGSGDPKRGQELFQRRCASCHSLDTEKEGPRLRGVVGRKSGAVQSFNYSDALKKANITWDADSLDQWLSDTDKFIPDNDMNISIRDAGKRNDIIAFLKQLSAQ